MVSEIDWEYLQIMRDIEEKADTSRQDKSKEPTSSRPRLRAPSGRTQLLALILILLIVLIYTAYLAGLFGTTPGQRGIWREAYRNQTDHLERRSSDLFRMLIAAREELDQMRSLADERLADLNECRTDLSSSQATGRRLESRYWEAELSLNGTIGELIRVERERDEWEEGYENVVDELNSLEEAYASMEDQLSRLEEDLEDAGRDKAVVQEELKGKAAEITKLQVAIGLLYVQVGLKEKEVDDWILKFHELELEYRDLLCELEFCQYEKEQLGEFVERWQSELAEALGELESCRTRTERILAALDMALTENQNLRRLYDSMSSRLEFIVRERDRFTVAYRDLLRNQTLLIDERDYLQSYCENLTLLLIEAESERDHWFLLHQQASTQLSICLGQVGYWKDKYDTIFSQLESTFAEIEQLSAELDNCTQVVEEWISLYQTIQEQLQNALSEVDYWQNLYMDLANITVDLSIDNLVVLERIDGKPSVVSADITVCVTTVDTPVLLLLEFWGEPIDCIWGYGSVLDNISEWTGNCSVFNVTMDFGIGVSPYKVVAKATLRPVHGMVLVEEVGPP